MDELLEVERNVLLLFERPNEPIWLEKSSYQKDDEYNDVASNEMTSNRQQEFPEKNHLVNTSRRSPPETRMECSLPDLSTIIRRDETFSVLNTKHLKSAFSVVDMLMQKNYLGDIIGPCMLIRDSLNPMLFNYALSYTLMHRDDSRHLKIPSLIELFPDRFMSTDSIRQARQFAKIMPAENVMTVDIPYASTASKNHPEVKLAYFREDIGVNLHHWHWHLVYPFGSTDNPLNVSETKDRRGELFYYMHSQKIARYNIERIANGMKRLERLANLNEPIPDGYFPKLSSNLANQTWHGRPDNTKLADVNRGPTDIYNVCQNESWQKNILEAIEDGFAVDTAENRVNLNNHTGIDHLGNMTESSEKLSLDKNFYGEFHNHIHMMIAYTHDPLNRYKADISVVGAIETSMRDPVFYRIHSQVDYILQKHKLKLQPYTEKYLNFHEISVTSLNVRSEGLQNILRTFFDKSSVSLARGIEFLRKRSVFARFKHLNHAPFTYEIDITNDSNTSRNGTIRIFIAPQLGYDSERLDFEAQRLFMVEIDKFSSHLLPGINKVVRSSMEASISVPQSQIFRTNLQKDPNGRSDSDNLCGCGWPHYYLIPRGTEEGMKFDLFAMVSDYAIDRADVEDCCTSKMSYCGLRDKKYPDVRPMGFPFDRRARNGIDNLKDFLTPNMRVQEIIIKHSATA